MPYNTRRKSLSLPLLGIQLPNSSARSSINRSPPSTHSNAHKQVDQQPSKEPPTKRAKRSHSSGSNSSTPATPLKVRERTNSVRFRDERQSRQHASEQTPPPSPGEMPKIDFEGIDDPVVVAVLQQLQETGNKPHLLRELSAVLATKLPSIESAQNPSSIISSRLSNYMRRPWTALAPCPLGKELVNSHSKRIYYYLTSLPRQAFPDNSSLNTLLHTTRVISPSVSSASDTESGLTASSGPVGSDEGRSRMALSPSPELDLFFPDLDAPESPRSAPPSAFPHSRRAASPALERDEREFTQTATSLQRRSKSAELERQKKKRDASASSDDAEAKTADTEMQEPVDGPMPEEESEEKAALRNSEAAAALFESFADHTPSFSSPELRATSKIENFDGRLENGIHDGPMELDVKADRQKVAATQVDVIETSWAGDWSMWSELKSPENVELDELDDLFGNY